MIETVKQTINAKNILKIKEIIDIAYEYVETNLSVSVIKDYVPYAFISSAVSFLSGIKNHNGYVGGPYEPPGITALCILFISIFTAYNISIMVLYSR